jgi:membrane protease YdiL (CAAX protease family)
MIFVLLAMGVACGVILVPVHYRGLARRLRHLPTQSLFTHGSLKGAWYGLGVALIVPMAAVILASPESVAPMFDGKKAAGMFGAMLWGTVFGLLCLVPATMRMSRRELVGDRATWRAWKRIPLALAILWIVGILQTQFHHWTGGGGDTLHTEIIDTVLGEGNAAMGGFGALLVVALLGPVMEEIVLRGLLLGGLTRHLSFRWANILQALVFALMHDDAPRFAFYFALGLLAGWLVKSTRSLGPAIALHVLNNGLVVALTMLT